jgi:regulator of protease activity HflC (stomatin/prohibitin superfamily)
VAGKYEAAIDRHSAHEILAARAAAAAQEAEQAEAKIAAEAVAQKAEAERAREFKAARRYSAGTSASQTRRAREPEGLGGALASVVMKELTGTTGRRIVRGILGGLFKGR